MIFPNLRDLITLQRILSPFCYFSVKFYATLLIACIARIDILVHIESSGPQKVFSTKFSKTAFQLLLHCKHQDINFAANK